MPGKHQLRRLALLGASGGILLTAVVGFGGGAVASTTSGIPAARVGSGTLKPIGTVNLSTLPSTIPGSTTSPTASVGPLERDGKPLSLPSRSSETSKPAAAASSARVNAAGGVAVSGPLCSTACTVHHNFDGIDLTTSNCGCVPPDVNAAISPKNDVESVNLDLAVYSLTGTLVKSTSLNSFFGTTLVLSDPRVLYDNAWQRFVLSLTVVPASTTSTPLMFIAASQTNKANGTWNRYQLSFGGGSFPAGTLLDQPLLGMDQDGVIVSTNNFQLQSNGTLSYVGSVVFAMAKQRLYNGLGLGFGGFGVAFSTAPAMMAGLPQQQTGKEFMLAADTTGGGRLDIYYMTNSSRPDSTAVTLEATPAMAYAPPSRRVIQPGTSNTLAPDDGRIDWAPMENAESGSTTVWFAHGIDIAGFPGIQYGVATVNLGGSDSVTAANAFHSSTSDDFNPSIAVNPEPGTCTSCAQVWLNWAYDDAPANVATSDTVNNVAPTGGVPTLSGSDTTYVTGSITSETRFGDYSSVAINPAAVGSCGAGNTALAANQYFASDGTWHTRLAEVGFC